MRQDGQTEVRKWLLCVPSGLTLKKFYVLPKGYIYVPYGSEKKQWLFVCREITDCCS